MQERSAASADERRRQAEADWHREQTDRAIARGVARRMKDRGQATDAEASAPASAPDAALSLDAIRERLEHAEAAVQHTQIFKADALVRDARWLLNEIDRLRDSGSASPMNPERGSVGATDKAETEFPEPGLSSSRESKGRPGVGSTDSPPALNAANPTREDAL